MNLTPTAGRIVDANGQRCGFSPEDTEDTDCGQPATWHIVWDMSLENGLACGAHMAHLQQNFVYLDRHTVSPDCAAPGACWLFDEKRCAYPEDDTEPQALAYATAGSSGDPS